MSTLRGLLLLVIFVAPACAGGETTAPAPSMSTTTTEVPYGERMLSLVDEAEALIERTPETPANDYGWATVAAAYRGLARAMEEVPAPSPVTHEAFIAEAEMIAEEAEALADKTDSIARLGGGLSLAERQREFRDAIAAL
jgi:hypothetical protein